MDITEAIAKKVVEAVDAGLVAGVGIQEPGKMCVEAAVCYALGLPHGDDPRCVSLALRSLKIRLNDASWSSPQARAKGLRRLAVAQLLGSRDVLEDREFVRRVARMTIQRSLPVVLRRAATKNPAHAEALNTAALRCEQEGTREAALEAKSVARKAAGAYAADAADAAYADARGVCGVGGGDPDRHEGARLSVVDVDAESECRMKTLTKRHCSACGWAWVPRQETPPKKCPRCQSPRWNQKPRQAVSR